MIEAELEVAGGSIQAGHSIGVALERAGALTPTAVRLVRLGEETGRLSTMLQHGASIETADALSRLGRLVRLVEPVLVFLFGGLVMFVSAALMQAMYALRPPS